MKDLTGKIFYMFEPRVKRQLIALLFAIFLGAVFELLGVSLIMPLIQVISQPDLVETNKYLAFAYGLSGAGDLKGFFIFLVIIIVSVYIFKNVYMMVMYFCQYSFIYNNQLKVESRLLDAYLKKPYTYHLDHNSSDMIRNIMLDSERLFQLILSVLNLLSEGLLSMLLILYLFVSDPVMTVTLFILLGACMGVFRLCTKKAVNNYGHINQEYDGRMHQAIDQALGAVKDIKILHREKYFVKSYTECGQKKMKALIFTNFFGTIPRYLIEAVCITGIMSVLVWKLQSGTDLNSIIPALAAFAMAAFKLLPSVGKISNYANLISFLRPSIDLIYRDIKETEDMGGFELTDKGTPVDISNADKISIENVTYRYPTGDRDVLENVSFDIPLGTSIGLIGPSGAGKSTMADVILGILFPNGGRIKYGAMNVHEYPFKWAEKLAYIPQAIFLSDDSIRRNVAFGIDDDQIDDSKVRKALSEAQLLDFIESLPEGLDTKVGERGVRLSGGQRQRIGIARALYGNPEILVLDEATAALDNDTESAVMEAIDSLHGRKTMLIIAHRLTTIENCDMVFKVENGKVIKQR